MSEIINQLREVWGQHNEFRENGIPYVCWVIQRQLKEMKEENYDPKQCAKEFCDIILICMRQLDEMGIIDVESAVLTRLNTRMRGNTDSIIAKEVMLWKSSEFKENGEPHSLEETTNE